MKKIDANLLLEKYKSGTISDEERMLLESWYLQEIKSNRSLDGLEEHLNLIDKDISFMLQQSVVKHKNNNWKKMVAAASVLIVLFAGLWFYTTNKPDFEASTLQVLTNDVPAGKKSATLTLSNGKKIKLTDAMSGELAEETGVRISKTANGEIVYEILPGVIDGNRNSEYIANTLSTASGESYQVRLPDGSLVILNAASSLTYATNLNELDVRRVTLSGEAYFEISENKKHPFVVKTATHEVEVLGTHFNVNSYSDESVAKTTLIEGSVKIRPTLKDEGTVILKPGEQATLTPKDPIRVAKVDTEEVLAWKNGYFLFNDEEIGTILKKISRWYNVEIKYESKDITERFNGMISREKSLSQVLTMLQRTDVVTFNIEERRVIVR